MGKLAEELDDLIESKINGTYSLGTAGEFYNITEREFDEINLLLADKYNSSSTPFQIGACHMSPIISLERVKRSKALKPNTY